MPCLHWHLPVVAPRPLIDSQSPRRLFSAQDRNSRLSWLTMFAVWRCQEHTHNAILKKKNSSGKRTSRFYVIRVYDIIQQPYLHCPG